MASVLVVDDSAVDRRLAGGLLEKHLNLEVAYAEDGKVAVKALAKAVPDVVLTDMQMPGMNGLELVEHIRAHHPQVPVILITAFGSEELAVQALKRGAASYVPKRLLAEELATTVESILEVARAEQEETRLQEALAQTESTFLLDNDPALIPPLIAHVQAGLRRLKLCDDTGSIRVTVALREAILNAMEHGNLELSSRLREQGEDDYHRLAHERRQQQPFRDRRVHVVVRQTRSDAVFVVRDEGPGFDPGGLPDPTDPANLENVSGRGLLLIRTFMDVVYHSDKGREITMTVHRSWGAA
jgi:CheY-like chemotaxis protein/anti-sigma regulatory factor (Ser/Thr protein kinase)